MRIKQIELLGFKSFKDKTTLTFPAGVTAIVGPNGCGKSNVVDALRWVLGEQSSRQLRGVEMSDVVFAGTQGNAPLGMAEVKLLLENTDTPVAPQPEVPGNGSPVTARVGNGWTEMMVSRRYFRSGESEYFLNNIPCRLRDIVEFFLGTGAGSKAYAIIEQGRVEHLINAKADDIRVLIEEAAGVSLYRSRRLAAERKLERTQDNLARVADLLSEMERQLGTLRRQAKKAAQYQALQEELQTLDLSLLCHAYQTLLDELVDLDRRRTAVLAEETALEDRMQQLQAERLQAQTVLENQEAALHASEERVHAIQSTLQQGEQRKEFLLHQEQRAADRAGAAQTELAAVEERRSAVQNEVESLAEQTRQSQIQLAEEEAVLSGHEQDGGRLQDTLLSHEAAAEELKTEIVDVLTQHAQVQNGLAYARRRGEELADRLQVLATEAEQASASLAETEQSLATTHTRAAELDECLRLGQRERGEKTDGLQAVVRVGEQLEQELAGAWAKQAELRTRLSTLKEMEQGYERYAPGVQSIMAEAESLTRVVGVVAQMLEVPHSYERAVAAVLREKLEYVVVAEVGDGLTAVEYLHQAEAGHGSFIPLQPRIGPQPASQHNGHALTVGQGLAVVMPAPSEPDGLTPLLSLLSVAPQGREVVESLLADTFLVPDLRTGLECWQRDHQPRTFVTPSGEVLTAQGVVSGGSQGIVQEGLLERRREIRDLHDQVEQHDSVVADLIRRRQEAKRSRQELEGELARLEAQARAWGEERQALHARAAQLEGEQRRLLDKKESIGYERQTLEEEQSGLGSEIAGLATRESELDDQRQEREARLAERQEQVAQAKLALEHQREVCDELRVRVAERRERQEGLRTQRSRLQEQQTELAERAATCQAEHRAAQAEADQIQTELTEQATRTAQHQTELASVGQEHERQQDACTRLRASCRAYEEELEQCRASLIEFQEEKTRLEVKSAEKRVSCDHINTAGYERYEIAIPGVLAQYASAWLETETAEARRQELRDKIGRLGEVNPGAAVELVAVEQRHMSLKEQEADLQASIADLQRTIAKLNRESRDRFRETFGLVDAKFRHVYERLVEGGSAQISLTDENDPTHSGVEISVQPPGKRLRSLQLLSGGERALAALSFTFALFLIRPSPFCVLDEVDAPLDDANVGRFNQLVREISQTTQVILITHNKRTMEAASTLYGVTMQEPGISTVVSVSLS
ncbi:MAG: chromosome segregation protein SMC [Desulfurellaceae bacterium]|nr:chromosome segregation protein SMC [Desulfurellaceae bacterium]